MPNTVKIQNSMIFFEKLEKNFKKLFTFEKFCVILDSVSVRPRRRNVEKALPLCGSRGFHPPVSSPADSMHNKNILEKVDHYHDAERRKAADF